MCIGDGAQIGFITYLPADQSTPPTCERAYIQAELTELRQEGEQLVVFAICHLMQANNEARMVLSWASGIGSVRDWATHLQTKRAQGPDEQSRVLLGQP